VYKKWKPLIATSEQNNATYFTKSVCGQLFLDPKGAGAVLKRSMKNVVAFSAAFFLDPREAVCY